MNISDRQARQLLWEAHVISCDPRHPINDRRHPAHDQSVAALKLIEEQGRGLLKAREQKKV